MVPWTTAVQQQHTKISFVDIKANIQHTTAVLAFATQQKLPMATRRGNGANLGRRGAITETLMSPIGLLLPLRLAASHVHEMVGRGKLTFAAKPPTNHLRDTPWICKVGNDTVAMSKWCSQNLYIPNSGWQTMQNGIMFQFKKCRQLKWKSARRLLKLLLSLRKTKCLMKRCQLQLKSKTLYASESKLMLLPKLLRPKRPKSKSRRDPTTLWSGTCMVEANVALEIYRARTAALATKNWKTTEHVETNIDQMATTIKARGISWLKTNTAWRESLSFDPAASAITEACEIPTAANASWWWKMKDDCPCSSRGRKL